MPSVNLIPAEYLLGRRKQRRVRMWLIAGGMAWIFATIPVVREFSAEFQLSTQRAAAATISEQVHTARSRRGESATRLTLLHQEIARAQKLRYKRLWTAMISVIAEAVPNRVWLTKLATDPHKPAVASGATSVLSHRRSSDASDVAASSGGYEKLIGKSGPRRLILEGQALGLEDIYGFVDALNELNVFANASIRSVRGDQNQGIKVTRFTLECEW